MNKAVFLDRDGTINEEYGYVHTIDNWQYTEGAIDALINFKKLGYLIFVITNQSGIARGYYSIDRVNELHAHVNSELAQYSAAIDGFYICPHHPAFSGFCECRKPSPEMIEKASRDHRINLSLSYMVGDKISDINAGISAGCMTALVETGYGSEEKSLLQDRVNVFENLLKFSIWLKDND